jgi:hypothetical protein
MPPTGLSVLRPHAFVLSAFLLVAFPFGIAAQSQPTHEIPRVLSYSTAFKTSIGEPRTGSATVHLRIYGDQTAGEPLWSEDHDVVLGPGGSVSLLIGSRTTDGLPLAIFADGLARWLAVQINDEPEEPRTIIISVPYALKAANADKLAGYSIEQFVLQPSTPRPAGSSDANAAARQPIAVPTLPAVTTLNFLQKGDNAGGVTDSSVVETGGNVGVGTTTPTARLTAFNNAAFQGLFNGFTSARGSADAHAVNGEIRIGGNADFQGRVSYYGQAFGRLYIDNSWNDDGGDIYFRTKAAASPVDAMVIRGTGNVGIGTVTPASKLHVNGDVRIEGNVSNSTKHQALFTGFASVLSAPNSASAANGEIRLGTNPLFQARFGYDGLIDGRLYIDNTWNGAGGDIYFRTRTSSAGSTITGVAIKDNGNVGIGTAAPTAKLHVNGDVRVDGNIAAKYQDVAEWVDSTEPLEPGTIVVVDANGNNRVTAAAKAYDSAIIGAVSAQPGIVLGEGGPGRLLVAQSGRVRVKVDARYGRIRPGDLLVTSPRKGYAMRSRPIKVGGNLMHRPGTVLGKALEPLVTGTGEILVLLTLQ